MYSFLTRPRAAPMRRVALACVLVVGLGACASAPLPTAQMAVAEAAVLRATSTSTRENAGPQLLLATNKLADPLVAGPGAWHADPSRLSAHCRQCETARSRMHRVLCAAEAVHGFLAPRFVTTLALAMVLLLISGALPI